MDQLNKKFLCRLLNEEVNVIYFVDRVLDIEGKLKTKVISHYNCNGTERCGVTYNLRDCTCFREMKHTEVEINEIGNHSQ